MMISSSNNKITILLFLISISFVFSIFQEEIGVKDWRIKNIGLVERSIIYKGGKSAATLLVQSTLPTSNNYILSLLNLEDGSIIWRQILPRQEHSFESLLKLSNSQFITLSDGHKLRLWNRESGSIVWSNSLVGEDSLNANCKVVKKLSSTEIEQLSIVCESITFTVNTKNGAIINSNPTKDEDLNQVDNKKKNSQGTVSSESNSNSIAKVNDNKIIIETTTADNNKKVITTQFTEKLNGLPLYLNVEGEYSVLVTADWTLSAYQGEKKLFTREESLASVVQTEITESLPSNIAKLSQLEYEFTESSNDTFLSHLTRRLQAQLYTVLGKTIGADESSYQSSQQQKHASQSAIWTDDLNKLIVVATTAGKLHCLHSSDRGTIAWSLYYPNVNQHSGLKLHIIGRQPDIKAIVIYTSIADNSKVISTVNLNSGVEVDTKTFSSSDEILHTAVLPSSSISDDTNTNADNNSTKLSSTLQDLFMIVFKYPDIEQPSLQILPWNAIVRSKWDSLKKINFYLVDEENSIVRGYSIESIADGRKGLFKSHMNWNLNLGRQQSIVAIGANNPHEVIGSPAIILGNRDLLPKYLNRNLISIATVDSASSVISIHLVDSITGEIIKTFLHQNAGGKVSIVHIENSVIYSYTDIALQKQIISTIDLFESEVNWNKKVFSSFDSNNNIAIKQKSFVFPQFIQTLSESVSAKGITSKFILIGTVSGQILPLEKKWIDARRPYPSEATPFDQEEGLIPYHSGLNFPPHFYITYNTSIPFLNSMKTLGTAKESTSLIVSTGIDLFAALIAPSSRYDVLSETFNHFALVSTSLLLAALTYVTKILRKNKNLNRKWK